MKKITISILAFALAGAAALAGCSQRPVAANEFQAQEGAGESAAAARRTPAEISAALGALTQADGAGTIPLGIAWPVLKAKLDQLGIVYIAADTSLRCTDGTTYLGSDRGVTEVIQNQSALGLAAGDGLAKAQELYGAQTPSFFNDSWFLRYETASGVQCTVGLDGGGANAKVTYVSVAEIPDWMK
ncbi:MAG: hypothetical protein LBJ11_05055 [Oscillospiraceae bacterium]|jgi:hypothetical protein|nr:hypothetical protein [Oscillospiraceae bacterium]